ncbi:MAG: histidine triad nucleotide-binding protein [Myxococcales bacterium]|nr:histidine triad nucleotide-binding protein [Myxococcales bacterium]
MADCLFCKIRDGEIPAKLIHQDDRALAFHDLHAQAPLHALVIPRRHIATLNDAAVEDEALIGHLARVAAEIARDAGYAESGYRTVFNVNRGGGQTVFHLHLHVLGGRALEWPPG